MLNLTGKLHLSRATVESPNLTGKFNPEDLARIGEWVHAGYERDKFSRIRWEQRMEAAMNLALQVQEAKNWPWPDCSNIAFPLITIAALQFHSRAYPMIVQGSQIVRYKVWGAGTPQDAQRALRIGTFMSWQLLEEDEDWEEQHDRMLIQLPIVGCAFKKSYYNGEHNDSELVSAFDLVVDYWAKSIEGAARKTHVIPLSRNEVWEKIARGIFRDVREESWFQSPAQYPVSEQEVRRDNRVGENVPPADETTPFQFLEQHCLLDLDQDGYAEPYIITVEASSRCVVRIVSRIENFETDVERNSKGEIVRIRPWEYFTKYGFIPSPDGGIYDLGFGVLLGPLNESVNSILNQLVDAGTLNNLGGGFLARGVKVRGGVYNVAPFQWARVDSTGDDLRKGIFPLPTKEPSAVLFQLLGMLINYTERISGATDMLVGQNPGQNTPAETSRTMVEQGMKVYSNIFKRIWRGMKGEFKKLYELNALYLPDSRAFGEDRISKTDFIGGSSNVTPVADPNITSESLRMWQAQAVKQSAMMTPGYDIPAVELEYLRALKVESPERIYPGPGKVPPLPNPKVQVEQMKLQGQQAALQQKQQQFILTLQEEHRLNTAKMMQLEAQAHQFLANAQGEAAGHQVAAFNAAIAAAKSHNEHLRGMIDLVQKGLQNEQDGQSANPAGGVGGLETSPGDQSSAGMGGGMAQ